jgi:DNA-binding transcriptional LysR family regulator
MAIRIAELHDSSLIARQLAPAHRLLVAAPGYLAAQGTPQSIADLDRHTLLNHTGEPWRLEGPGGLVQVRTQARIITNSSEVVREAVLTGLGIPSVRAGAVLE